MKKIISLIFILVFLQGCSSLNSIATGGTKILVAIPGVCPSLVMSRVDEINLYEVESFYRYYFKGVEYREIRKLMFRVSESDLDRHKRACESGVMRGCMAAGVTYVGRDQRHKAFKYFNKVCENEWTFKNHIPFGVWFLFYLFTFSLYLAQKML